LRSSMVGGTSNSKRKDLFLVYERRQRTLLDQIPDGALTLSSTMALHNAGVPLRRESLCPKALDQQLTVRGGVVGNTTDGKTTMKNGTAEYSRLTALPRGVRIREISGAQTMAEASGAAMKVVRQAECRRCGLNLEPLNRPPSGSLQL
jgi:hypothetical protein